MLGGIDDDQIDLTDQDGILVTGNVVGASGSRIKSIKCNFGGGAAPDGSASFSAGYSVGSRWHHGSDIYECVGDGVWVRIYPATGGVPSYGQLLSPSVLSSDGVITGWSTNIMSGSVSAYGNTGMIVSSLGIYLISFTLLLRVTTGEMRILLHKNGSLAHGSKQMRNELDVGSVSLSLSTIESLSAGDRVELYFDETATSLVQSTGIFFMVKIA